MTFDLEPDCVKGLGRLQLPADIGRNQNVERKCYLLTTALTVSLAVLSTLN